MEGADLRQKTTDFRRKPQIELRHLRSVTFSMPLGVPSTPPLPVKWTPDSDTYEKHQDTPPISIAILAEVCRPLGRE